MRLSAAIVWSGMTFLGVHSVMADVLYASSFSGNLIYSISPTGSTSPYVTGISQPQGLALDNSGNLYVSVYGGGVIDRITPQKVVTTYASDSALNHPQALAFDGLGDLFVTTYGNDSIVKIGAVGGITILASFNGQDYPEGLAVDSNNNVYVAMTNSNRVLKYAPDGTSTVFASGFYYPQGLAFDKSGNLYVANEGSSGNGTISKVTPAGVVTTFATARSNDPYGLAFGSNGVLYAANFVGSSNIDQFNTAGQASQFASGYANSTYIVATPEPGSVILSGLAGIWLAVRRGRRGVARRVAL